MGPVIGTVSAVLVTASLTASAFAQAPAKPAPAKPAPAAERYFTFSEAEIEEQGVAVDGLVRLKRAGGKPGEDTIDICFPVRLDSGEIDRFAAPLTVSKTGMTAAGTSLVGRVRTELSLTTTNADRRVRLQGEIRYGDTRIKIREQSADDEEGSADQLFEGASRTSLQSPNEIVAKLELRAVRPLLDVLRRNQAAVQPAQLIPGCSDYREGRQVIRIQAAPARMVALAEALKAVPGVVSVDLPVETSMREDGIRLPDRLATTADRALVDSFGAVARRSLGAQAAPEVRANGQTGEHVLVFTRDTRVAKALGLAEAVAITLLVAPDPYDRKKRVLYITQIGSKFVDPSAAPLQLSQDLFESAAYTDIQPRRISAMLSAAFAAEIGGEQVFGAGSR